MLIVIVRLAKPAETISGIATLRSQLHVGQRLADFRQCDIWLRGNPLTFLARASYRPHTEPGMIMADYGVGGVLFS